MSAATDVVVKVGVDEKLWNQLKNLCGKKGDVKHHVNRALKIYAGITKGLAVAVKRPDAREIVRIDEIEDIRQFIKGSDDLVEIYPIFGEISLEIIKKFVELALKYVDEDGELPESSPAISVRSPEKPNVPQYVRERDAEKLVNFALAGYRVGIRMLIDNRIGFLTIDPQRWIDITVF